MFVVSVSVLSYVYFFFFKQKTAYEMRISDWSSDVCSSDLQQLVVQSRNDRIVRLGDLATVGTGSLTRYGAVSKNGQAEAVQGLVIALRGADARQVVDGVRTRLAEIESTLPTGTHVDVFYDRSDLIARAVGPVEKALLEAAVLVVVQIILFLGDCRAAAIVAAPVPLAAATPSP